MQAIPMTILDKIKCVGNGNPLDPQICAANGSSYYQPDAWTIFLQSSNIKVSTI
jgi:hypothetical protein